MADEQSYPDMDKKTAEEILGFGSSVTYSQKDMTEKYHQTVSEKVGAGASEEDMARVDHAKAYLDSYFVEDPSASLTSDSDIGKHSGSYTESSFDFSFISSAFDAAGNSMESDYDRFGPPALNYIYSVAHGKAARKLGYKDDTVYDVPELTGDFPLWYQAVSKFILRFPWRLLFAIAVAWFCYYCITNPGGTTEPDSMSSILAQGFTAIMWVIVGIVLIAVNSIWGLCTNLVRRVIYGISERILQWQITAICKKALSRQMKGSPNAQNIVVPSKESK